MSWQTNSRIMNQVLTQEESSHLQRFNGDVTDADAVKKAVEAMKPTHIIHLGILKNGNSVFSRAVQLVFKYRCAG